VPIELVLVAASVLLTRPLYASPLRKSINRILDAGSIAVSDGDVLRMAPVFLVCSAVLFILSATWQRSGFLASTRRFVNELYVAVLASSLSALYIFTFTDISFAPAFFLLTLLLVLGAFLMAFAIAKVARINAVPSAGDELSPRHRLIGAVARTFVSPRHIAVGALCLSPLVLAILYKADDRVANAINNLRIHFSAANTGWESSYELVDAFPELVLDQPIALAEPKYAENELYVLERPGRIVRVRAAADAAEKETLLDFGGRVSDVDVENGALGMALHPEFGSGASSSAGFVYVYYTARVEDKQHNRLARFDLSAPDAESRLQSEQVLIELERNSNGFHNAGCVAFGPDGYLYASFGDALDKANHQAVDRGFFCSVIRIDVDKLGGRRSHRIARQPAIGRTQEYFIPNDNPFVGKDGALEELYVIGLRNPFRFSIDQTTGLVWISENGDSKWEEINVVSAGANCQYPAYEANELRPDKVTPGEPLGVDSPPFFSYPHTSIDRSVIGGVVYRGERFADLKGMYLFGDGCSGRIYSIDSAASIPESRVIASTSYKGQVGVSSFLQTRSGDILVTVLGSKKAPSGKILALADVGTRAPGSVLASDDGPQSEMTAAEFFTAQCAICHGPEGKGDGPRVEELPKKPRDLTQNQWQASVTDEHLFEVISKGGAAVELDNGMPGWHLMLRPKEIEEMVQYVRSLEESTHAAAGK
jgi:glucose/arabinose dehydrogenase